MIQQFQLHRRCLTALLVPIKKARDTAPILRFQKGQSCRSSPKSIQFYRVLSSGGSCGMRQSQIQVLRHSVEPRDLSSSIREKSLDICSRNKLDGQHAIVEAGFVEDIGKASADNAANARVVDGPRSVLATRFTAKVVTGNQSRQSHWGLANSSPIANFCGFSYRSSEKAANPIPERLIVLKKDSG